MQNTTRGNVSKGATTPSNADFWYIAFVIVAVAIVTGNTLTIVIFSRKRRKNMLLISLAIADLIIGFVAVPMYIYLLHVSFYQSSWKDDVFPRIYVSVDVFVGLASIFALTLIALERVYAIFWPFEFRCIATRTYWILIAHGWAFAAFLAIVQLVAFQKPWSIYSLDSVILVSVVTIVVAYTSILVKINKANRSGTINESFVEEKHICLVLSIVTAVFLCTWLPFFFLNLIGSFNPAMIRHLPFDVAYVAKLLHYGNSFMNPVIYSLVFPEFRTTLKIMLRRRRLSQEIVANEVVYRCNSIL